MINEYQAKYYSMNYRKDVHQTQLKSLEQLS